MSRGASFAAICLIIAFGCPLAQSKEAGQEVKAVSVAAEIVGGSAYRGEDLLLRLTFRNSAEPVVEIPAVAFSKEAFTLTDPKGRPPKGSGVDPIEVAEALRIDGYGTAVREVPLSAWYPRITSSITTWTLSWDHGPWRIEAFPLKVIRPYDARRDRHAVIETDLGTMKWELLSDAAPEHVKRFVDLSREGFYDGLSIFRVTPGGTAEGGDPKGDGSGAWDRLLHPEIVPGLEVGPGMVGAARRETSMTSDCMFFITLAPSEYMSGKHTFYARIVDGLEFIAFVQRAENYGNTGLKNSHMLVDPVTIRRVRIK